jgi:hypothetical protein
VPFTAAFCARAREHTACATVPWAGSSHMPHAHMSHVQHSYMTTCTLHIAHTPRHSRRVQAACITHRRTDAPTHRPANTGAALVPLLLVARQSAQPTP